MATTKMKRNENLDKESLKQVIEDFFVERGHSASTQAVYRHVLLELIDVSDLAHLDAPGLLRFADRPKWGNSMQYLAVSASRSFLKYLFGSRHPALLARKRRTQSKPQRSLTAHKATVLLASFDSRTPKGARDLAIAALAIDTRLRVAELARLRLPDVDLQEQKLKVIIKGGDWGTGVFSFETAQIISNWLYYRQPNAGVQELFLLHKTHHVAHLKRFKSHRLNGVCRTP